MRPAQGTTPPFGYTIIAFASALLPDASRTCNHRAARGQGSLGRLRVVALPIPRRRCLEGATLLLTGSTQTVAAALGWIRATPATPRRREPPRSPPRRAPPTGFGARR